MAYEKRIKGTTRWRATSEKEAFELVGFLRLGDLAAGATVETPYAYVRLRSVQQVLPGIGEEKPGAYGGGQA